MDWQKELNPQQYAAVSAGNGPLLVLAGAGSGKTRVITHRIAYLLSSGAAEPREILALTFTNKAAGEMRERVARLINSEPPDLWISTFHSLGVRMLRRDGPRIGLERNFVIYDDQDQMRLLKECLKDLEIDDQAYPARAFRERIERAKNYLSEEFAASSPRDFIGEKTAAVYALYEQRKKEARALDFGDLIACTVKLLREVPEVKEAYRRRWRYLLVDEYQDTNPAQYLLLKELYTEKGNLMVVGDDDQSIYRWRGADIRNILEFERDFPSARVVKLEENYRSTQHILAAAGAIVRGLFGRHEKTLWTANPLGEKVESWRVLKGEDEARWIAAKIKEGRERGRGLGDFAVFYRTNVQSRVLEEEFSLKGLPYQLIGALKFYDRQEVRDLMAYLKVAANPHDDLSLGRIINVPPRGIGSRTLEILRQEAKSRGVSLWSALQELLVSGAFAQKTQRDLESFRDLVEMIEEEKAKGSPEGLLRAIISRTKYKEMWEAKGPAEAAERLQNLEEFISVAREFERQSPEPGLIPFLDRLALVADVDSFQEDAARVSLMTLHSAKGLEFPVVFIAGLEEGLLPHERSRTEPMELEEERRLLYVGMTRAKEKLYLLHAASRFFQGQSISNQPSSFLDDLPAEHLITKDETIMSFRSSADTYAASLGEAFTKFKREERSRIDYSYSQATNYSGDEHSQVEQGYRRGMRVAHPTFGTGYIHEVKKSAEGLKVSVFFDRVGLKKLNLGYTSLQIIED